MILARLAEYAARMEERGEFTPPLYAAMPIRWIIPLMLDGTLRGEFISQGGDKANKRGLTRVVPDVGRTSERAKPNLLVDKSEYVLGYYEAPSQAKRARMRHESFVSLAEECAKSVQHPSLNAIVAFLKNWNFEESRERLPEGFAADDYLTFDVDGFVPVEELDSIQEFWANYNLADNAPIMNCLITGKRGPVEKVLPSTATIKGLSVIGGQSSGTKMVSANKEPFRSYGLQQSLTSPISRDAAERFGKSLNHLLSDRDSHVFVGPVVYVWWSKEKTGPSLRIVSEPEADLKSVQRLMSSASSGVKRTGTEAEKFYCLALSASKTRNTVRDWLETTIPEIERNLGRWFLAQEVVDAYGQPMKPIGVYRLSASAYRDATKEMQPTVPAAMIRVAISGESLPGDLLARAVRRNIVGTKYQNSETTDHVPRERAALVKTIFTTQGRFGVDEMKSLTGEPPLEGVDRAAYACGRLLAELEQIQREALGRGVNTTLVDRYYGAASTTPAKVFGLLVGNAQDHLSKIRKSRSGTYEALQRKLEEIAEMLSRYPNSLDVGQQGLFSLGYYHQRAENRAAAIAAREAKQNENTEGKES